MDITALVGLGGSGKSILMVAMGYDAHLEGRPVYSNMKHITGYPYTRITFTDLLNFKSFKKYAYVMLDEVSKGADAYDFFQAKPRAIAEAIKQLRKLEADLAYTVQVFGWTAKRLREVTTERIDMQDADGGRHKFGECGLRFRMAYLDLLHPLNPGTGEIDIVQAVFDGEPYKDMYDTHEYIDDD